MMLAGMILKYSKMLLDNKQRAISVAVLLSVLPFAAWLSVALVALVTLRKGARQGFDLLIPAVIIHSVPLMMLLPVSSALVNAAMTYIPCYCMAFILRTTLSWQTVCSAFLILVSVISVLVHSVVPHFVIEQFAQFKKIIGTHEEYQQLFDASVAGINHWDLAQLFFGVQILSVAVSALISLVFARSIQAKLFMPGGLKTELVRFRAGRAALLILIVVAVGSYYEFAVALNVLPLILGYFLLSGFGLLYCVIACKWQKRAFVLLLLPVVMQPALALFAYVVLGSLDSLFNFRLYLPGRVRETI